MSTTPVSSYKFLQKLHPLSLLAQLNGRRATGLLRIFTENTSWSLYLEEGKLTYASYSDKLFDRWEEQLQNSLQHIPTLTTASIAQARSTFEVKDDNYSIPNADYQAICWLVNQRAVSHSQATVLIQELARQAIASFLVLKQGSYEFYPEKSLDELPRFCRLDLRMLVEQCQVELRNQQQVEALQTIKNETKTVVKPAESADEITVTTEDEHLNGNEQIELNDEGNNDDEIPQLTSNKLYTVACIDDSPTVLASMKRFLESSTFSVVMINDPVKALMQILRSKPDLILLDVEMPNLDGYELCSLLRRHSAFKDIPIIMVTGRTGFIDRAKAKMVRSSGYLTKPFTQSELLKIVFKHLA